VSIFWQVVISGAAILFGAYCCWLVFGGRRERREAERERVELEARLARPPWSDHPGLYEAFTTHEGPEPKVWTCHCGEEFVFQTILPTGDRPGFKSSDGNSVDNYLKVDDDEDQDEEEA